MAIRIAVLALAVAGLTTTTAHADTNLGCPGFATASDASDAARLAGQMTGLMRTNLKAANIACARSVVHTVKRSGLPEHAATVAITTTIVETYVRNLDHGHGTSIGLFQQINAWGSFEQRTDPVWAANAFLEEMLHRYPHDEWASLPVGEVCQAVQRSGFPERYEPEAADGQRLAHALWQTTADPGPDVTGDGLADVVGVANGELVVHRGDGTGTFHLRDRDETDWGDVGEMDTGDVDGDNRADVVSTVSGQLVVHRGDGTGSFRRFALGSWGDFKMLNVTDVDGDRKGDIVAVFGDQLVHHRGDGTGSFHPVSQGGSGWAAVTQLEAGDVDGDGKADLVGVVNGRLVVHRGDGTGGFHLFGHGGTDWGAEGQFSVADVDGDRKADVVGVVNSQLVHYRSDGAGNFQLAPQGGGDWADLTKFSAS